MILPIYVISLYCNIKHLFETWKYLYKSGSPDDKCIDSQHFGTCDSHTDFKVKRSKVKVSHGEGAYCGGHLAAQLVLASCKPGRKPGLQLARIMECGLKQLTGCMVTSGHWEDGHPPPHSAAASSRNLLCHSPNKNTQRPQTPPRPKCQPKVIRDSNPD